VSGYDPWEDTHDGSQKMDTYDERETGYQLLAVLQRYAPDHEAKARCTEYLARMQRDGATQKEVDLAMAGALLDGLRYGNWLWNSVPLS
jgi:hypothetical protein